MKLRINRRWAGIVGAWHLYGLFAFNQSVFFYAATQGVVPWGDSLQRALLTTWFWIAVTPLVSHATESIRHRNLGLAAALVRHLSLALAIAVVNAGLDHARILVRLGTAGEGLGFQILYQLSENCLLYAVIVLATHIARLRSLQRKRERAAARLEARLARSELQLLRMQIRPHFLFNTFQSVSALIHSDPDAADRMIGHLSSLLRLSIEHEAGDLATVDSELDALDLYLSIQRARFDDGLRVEVDVDDSVRKARLPHLIMQPLVENAIVHGFSHPEETLNISIAIHEAGGRLKLVVRDDGAGAAEGALSRGEGVGLLNTQARLHKTYGPDASLEISTAPGAGFVVRVELPLSGA